MPYSYEQKLRLYRESAMMVTTDRRLQLEEAQEIADAYVSDVFGPNYRTQDGKQCDEYWRFMVICHRDDMQRPVAIGGVSVHEIMGQVEALSDERIRDMREAGAVQAAQERGELARDDDGYVLRTHARIKANAWTSNHIDLKVGARGGVFLPMEPPIWRFTVHDFAGEGERTALDVIDVDAETGQVYPFAPDKLAFLQGAVGAARKHQKLTAIA